MNVSDYMINHYTPPDGEPGSEDNRFDSRQGQVEFLTTIHYIEKYLTAGAKILEIGAASGKYSHYFAQCGYEVDAVELVPYNVELFKSKTQAGERVTIRQGNATDLSGFSSDHYDITLLLGPMYHLFDETDKLKALSEALRVTKQGGILFVAYCCPDASIIQYGFIRHKDGVEKLFALGLLDPLTFKASSRPEQIFELHRKEDIDALMGNFLNTERLHYIAADLLARYIAGPLSELTDEQFQYFMRYHLTICERADMVGVTNHALDILRKK